MYKAQFTRWNWHKYSKGAHERPGASLQRPPPRRGRKGRARASLSQEEGEEDVVNAPQLQTRLLEADESRHLTRALSAYRSLIATRAAAVTPFTRMGGASGGTYDPTMFSHFVGALKQLRRRGFVEGGRLLRLAFAELDAVVTGGHVAAAWDCCVAIPHHAAAAGRPDVLLTFLRHLTALCAARQPQGHPLASPVSNVMLMKSPVIREYTTRSLSTARG